MSKPLIQGYKNICDNCGSEWNSEIKTTVCPECIKKDDIKIYSHVQEPIINFEGDENDFHE